MKESALWQNGRRAANFFADPVYYRRLWQIALPIALQQFIMSSLNLVGGLMIGQLGESAVAGVGLANQIFFLLSLFLFGVTSGAAIFTAQLWGKADVVNIRKVQGLSITVGLAGALIFSLGAVVFPEWVLGIYSKDPAVVAVGAQYLRIYGWAFPFTAVTYSYSAVLRSTGDVKKPLIVSMTALSLNMVLAYGLIFGIAGLPRLGALGAGVAAFIARLVEFAIILFLTYRAPSPAAASLRELFHYDLPFARRVLQRVVPVAANELIWSLGITTYNIIYARIGTQAIAAVNIVATLDNLAFVIFIGLANATAILVGNQIGAGDLAEARRYATRSLSLSAVGAVVIGGLLLASANLIFSIYKVSPDVIAAARQVLLVIALFLWVRVSNLMLFIGIFRAGGDTRIAFILDAGIIWVVGVPMAYLGAFVLHLPIQWVYLMVMSDEVTKWVLGMYRFASRKWIHNLVEEI